MPLQGRLCGKTCGRDTGERGVLVTWGGATPDLPARLSPGCSASIPGAGVVAGAPPTDTPTESRWTGQPVGRLGDWKDAINCDRTWRSGGGEQRGEGETSEQWGFEVDRS